MSIIGVRANMTILNTWTLLGVLGATCAGYQDGHQGSSARKGKFCSLEYTRTLVKQRPSDEMVELTFDQLPRKIQGNMHTSLCPLTWGTHPQKQKQRKGNIYLGENIQVRVFAARHEAEDDLVDYRWTVDGREIRERARNAPTCVTRILPGSGDGEEERAIDICNPMKVDLALDRMDACVWWGRADARCVEEAKAMVWAIMKTKARNMPGLDYEVQFPWPDSLEDGISVTSAPQKNPVQMGQWTEGIDLFVDNGVFSMRVYMKLASSDKRHGVKQISPASADGQELRAIVSRNAMKLDIVLDSLDACAKWGHDDARCVAEAKALVSGIVYLKGRDTAGQDYEITFPWPNSLEDGVSFSSAPQENIIFIGHWSRRVDVFAENGVLSILVYEKSPQRMGYLDGSKWFDDDFRALIHRKARQQGKLPAQGNDNSSQ